MEPEIVVTTIKTTLRQVQIQIAFSAIIGILIGSTLSMALYPATRSRAPQIETTGGNKSSYRQLPKLPTSNAEKYSLYCMSGHWNDC